MGNTFKPESEPRCGEKSGFCEVKLEDILFARVDYDKLRKLPVLITAEWGTARGVSSYLQQSSFSCRMWTWRALFWRRLTKRF